MFDAQLLQKAQLGNRLAQYQLYRECYPILMSVCLRYLSSKTESVEQMNIIFLKILNHLHQFPKDGKFPNWICRIAINTLIDNFRKKKKWHCEVELSAHVEHTISLPPIPNDIEQQLDVEYLEEMVQQLPPIHRQVFNLHAIDGYAHAEIAQMLGIAEGSSKWYLNKARKKLQELYHKSRKCRQLSENTF